MKKKKIKQLSNVDAAYLAGLIDGEGTVALSHSNSNHRSPSVSIANTDYTLVEWPMQITGVGFICKKGTATKKKSHHLDSYIYAVHYDNALELLGQIYPYLKNKSKRARAKLLLDQYKLLTPRNGKYTAEELVARLKFEEEFLSL